MEFLKEIFFAHNCTFFCATINTNRFKSHKESEDDYGKKIKKTFRLLI